MVVAEVSHRSRCFHAPLLDCLPRNEVPLPKETPLVPAQYALAQPVHPRVARAELARNAKVRGLDFFRFLPPPSFPHCLTFFRRLASR